MFFVRIINPQFAAPRLLPVGANAGAPTLRLSPARTYKPNLGYPGLMSLSRLPLPKSNVGRFCESQKAVTAPSFARKRP